MAKEPLSSLLLPPLISFFIIHLMLLLHKVNSQQESKVSFEFTEFNQSIKNKLILQGDASISTNKNSLQLTSMDNNSYPLGSSVGRALYSNPIRFYDRTNKKRASFYTSFLFTTSSPPSCGPTPADGLAFFIASANTAIPPDSGGAYLGLFNSANVNLNNNSLNIKDSLLSSLSESEGSNDLSDSDDDDIIVFAVEFDTYPNPNIDPDYMHVGIDINSIKSNVTTKWDWQNGQVMDVTVFYDHHNKMLDVWDESGGINITHQIDLDKVLPEWVRVGFSASTGQHAQTNHVLSWNFELKLSTIADDDDNVGIASVVGVN